MNGPNRTDIPSPRERIAAFFERTGLGAEDRVTVGFSGGPDSAFLLRESVALLWAERIVAAHFNHGLRGAESDADEVFCKETASSLGIRFFSEKSDVLRCAREWKVGTEEAGRRLRYGFFERVRTETESKWIATGHTLDDQAETVLFRIAKGTGVRGMRGIPEVSGNVVRPLLTVGKSEILSGLSESGIPFRTDSSNSDTAYDRNRIRLSVLPELKKINPSVVRTLSELSAYATELDGFLERLSDGFLRGGDGFRQSDFERLDPVLKKEILSRLYVRANGTGIGLSTGTVEEMLRFVHEPAGGKSKRFWKLVLSRSKGRVSFWK